MEIEICINCKNKKTVQKSVMAAYEGGASRIELCSAMHLDGLTPSEEHIRAGREAFGGRPGLLVMVRPRAGDFSYINEELGVMRQQIEIAARCGADGIVLGTLKEIDQTVERSALEPLVDKANNLDLTVTFHRAFDATPDRSRALETLIECGVDRVLTSGMPWGTKGTALDGIDTITKLVRQANGRIGIVIGGGINIHNANAILEKLSAFREQEKRFISLHVYSGVKVNGSTSKETVSQLVSVASAFH